MQWLQLLEEMNTRTRKTNTNKIITRLARNSDGRELNFHSKSNSFQPSPQVRTAQPITKSWAYVFCCSGVCYACLTVSYIVKAFAMLFYSARVLGCCWYMFTIVHTFVVTLVQVHSLWHTRSVAYPTADIHQWWICCKNVKFRTLALNMQFTKFFFVVG